MTEEKDQSLKRLFRATNARSPEDNFTSTVMDHVRRYERRSAVYRSVIGVGALAIAWMAAPYMQSGAELISEFPGRAALSLAGGTAFADSALVFVLGLAATGCYLLRSGP